MAKKRKPTLLTNIDKDKVTKGLEPFIREDAYGLDGVLRPNLFAVYTKPTAKARVLILSCISPKTWLKYLISGSKKKNEK